MSRRTPLQRLSRAGHDCDMSRWIGQPSNTMVVCASLRCRQRWVQRPAGWVPLRWYHLAARWRYGLTLSSAGPIR